MITVKPLKMKVLLLRFLSFLVLIVLTNPVDAARPYGGFYTAEKINNLRKNCEKYDWAKEQRKSAIHKAKIWLAKEDAELWHMIPGQDLPRTIDVTMDRLTTGPKVLGCLKCGEKILKYGNYPYEPDFENKPWKLTCPSCKVVFPTNDFGKYYESAIDEYGFFNPAKGDKSLLYNAEHPDPKDPLHKYGVDDGFGYIDQNGRGHRFIGYYTWKYWDYVIGGLAALSNAYLYTGEKEYARKAAILLDRIADVYPDMDWKPYADRGWYHSDGGTDRGKIEGRIWETGVVTSIADSYDKIISGTVENNELYSFLKQQSNKYKLPSPKGSRDLFIKNVDDRLLREGYKGILAKKIDGNQGLHQLTMATCALALNTQPETSQWLDWIFASDGGNIPGLMISNFDKDGTTDEGAPGYTLIWGSLVNEIVEKLNGFSGYTKNNIVKDFPQFSNAYLAAYRMAALGIAIPNIGDSGTTGLVSRGMVKPEFIAQGYSFTRSPELAVAAYHANGNSAEGLARNIFSKDPDAISKEIKLLGEKSGPRPEGGRLLSGFGLALLESGSGKSGIALANNYGRTIKHAHPDLLNFDLLAFGHWLTPDHGYPEFATRIANNTEWTGSTVSHNVVFVNQHPQKEVWGAHTKLFKQIKGFGVFELDGKNAYPEIKDYTRTMFLISADGNEQDSNAYVVDIFKVAGGHDHLYSFHGPPGEITASGLKLTAQKGTYAGENIEKGAWSKGFPVGYSFFYNVKKDMTPPGQFMLDWKAEPGYRGLTAQDDVHLRMYALTPSNDVALADGDPPQNKPGNPRKLGYVLMHRKGTDLNSTFVSVIEPYKQKPFIKSVQRIDIGNDSQIAIRVEHINGNIDYVMYNPERDKLIKLPDNTTMTGTVGYVRKKGNSVSKGILVNGTSLKSGKMDLKSSGVITGKIVKMNKELAGGGWVLVDNQLPTDGSLNGQHLIVSTTGIRDATYAIRDVQKEGRLTKILCGPISFVSDFKKSGPGQQISPENFLYEFEEGASFQIPSHAVWEGKN